MIMSYLILVLFVLVFASYIRLMLLRNDCINMLDIEEGRQNSEKVIDKWFNWYSAHLSRKMLFPIAKKSKEEETNRLIQKYNLYVSAFWWSMLALLITLIVLIIVVNI